MTLIAMCAYDPPGESRHDLLHQCLSSLLATTNFQEHRLFIVNNGISSESQKVIDSAIRDVLKSDGFDYEVIGSGKNIGTARGINQAWKFRQPGEHCVKLDSDIVFHKSGWLDVMEECVAREPRIGQIGLKRPDLIESPWTKPPFDSELLMLPHQSGQTWLVVEKLKHVMGSCVLHNSALLDRVGYLYQMGGVYGYDDADMSCRSLCAGFFNCFLCNYPISHPDQGGTEYLNWKQLYAADSEHLILENCQKYESGELSLYRGPEDE